MPGSAQSRCRLVESVDALDAVLIETSQPAVLVFADDVALARGLAQSLRAKRATALLPLMVVIQIQTRVGATPTLGQLADAVHCGEILAVDLTRFSELSARVHRQFEEFVDAASVNDLRAAKLIDALRFAFSRGISRLEPQPSVLHSSGFHYGAFEAILGSSFETAMQRLVNSQLVVETFCDTVRLCPSCRDFRVNFREICSSCHSADLAYEDMIHHYRCGHVAPASEFQHDHQLLCTGCNVELLHIGVDYERPSAIYWCQTCAHRSTDATTQARCMACSERFVADDSIIRRIFHYEISAEAFSLAADANLWALSSSPFTTGLGLHSVAYFRELVNHHAGMVERYNVPFALCRVDLKAAAAESESPVDRNLFRVVATIAREQCRALDLCCLTPTAVLYVLLPGFRAPQLEAFLTQFETAVTTRIGGDFPQVLQSQILWDCFEESIPDLADILADLGGAP